MSPFEQFSRHAQDVFISEDTAYHTVAANLENIVQILKDTKNMALLREI